MYLFQLIGCAALLGLTASAFGQNCADVSKDKLPAVEGGTQSFGAMTYRGETQIWTRPKELHWVVVRGCGGGGGGGGAHHVTLFGGPGGEGTEPRLYLLGPLQAAEYLIVAGRGGSGASEGVENRLNNYGTSGQNGCPSEIYELQRSDAGVKVGQRLLRWNGGRGNQWINSNNPRLVPQATSYSEIGESGTTANPGIEAGKGGGGGMGRGGKGGSVDADAAQGRGGPGGDCAGGGGGTMGRPRNSWAGGNGGPGVLTLLPIADVAALLAPEAPVTETKAEPAPPPKSTE